MKTINVIGRRIEICTAKNKSLIGLKGKIIDETKNLLILKTRKGKKKILKNHIDIKIGNKKISGKKLKGHIYQRLKK